jgi:elongation factor Ts
LNSETDFVSRNEEFQNILNSILNDGIKSSESSISKEELMEKYKPEIQNLVLKVGENIQLGRIEKIVAKGNEKIFGYIHNEISKNLGTIGSMVSISPEASSFGNDLCMQIAAMSPKYLNISGLGNKF